MNLKSKLNHLMFHAILLMAFLQPGCAQPENMAVKDFLGPPMGLELCIHSPSGLVVTIKTVSKDESGELLIRQEFDYTRLQGYPESMPKTGYRDIRLSVQDQRLIVQSRDQAHVVLDMNSKQWPILLSQGFVPERTNNTTSSKETTKALPGRCWKSNIYERKFCGEARTIIEVSCQPDHSLTPAGERPPVLMTIVSGLGPLPINDLDHAYLAGAPREQ